jgi:hypothetical protein
MPIGFTNVDRNRRFEPFTAQNEACKRFNARYYPNLPPNQERYFNSRENMPAPAEYVSNENVFEPADYIQLINTSNKVKREMSSFSINGNDSKKTCLSSDEDLKKKKNKKKKKIK